MLGRMEAWNMALPDDALERGLRTHGNFSPLATQLRAAAAGEPIHLVVVGGSITVHNLFPQIFFDFLNTTLPAPSSGRVHALTNAGVSAIHAVPYEACVNRFMPANGTIYVLELTVNVRGGNVEGTSAPHWACLGSKCVPHPPCLSAAGAACRGSVQTE